MLIRPLRGGIVAKMTKGTVFPERLCINVETPSDSDAFAVRFQFGGGHMQEFKPGALEGVTVLDFTWVLAGTHATKMLADMGAMVIKVEQYPTGAIERQLPLLVEHEGVKQSSYSLNVNRGKKSVCVDVKKQEGMKIIHELVKKSDMIVENFAPGVMERLNLDYESVRKIKEDIIYCSISCFGHWGPYSHKPGYDVIAQAASGWTGQSEHVQIAPVSIGDTVAGLHAALALVAALHAKHTKGIGQNIDISMMDCLFSLHENTLPWYTLGQAVGKRIEVPKIGRVHPGYAPYGFYQGKDGWICIANIAESRWEPMVNVMGERFKWLLSDPRTATVEQRCVNTDVIHKAVDEWVMSMDSVEEVQRVLEEAGVPCMKVMTIEELADGDPQIQAREMMPLIEQPFLGPVKMYGSPLKMSETPSCIRGHAPLLGEHNYEVLVGVLGYAPDRVRSLYDSRVLYHEPAVERLQEQKTRNQF